MADKYINLSEARRSIMKHYPQAVFALDHIKSTEMVPVVTATWNVRYDKHGKRKIICSHCGFDDANENWKYCPECGATIRREEV